MKSSLRTRWLVAAWATFAWCAPCLPADTAPSPNSIPERPLAKKGAPLFGDDFERKEIGSGWLANAPSFTIVEGVLVGRQMRAEHGAVASAPVAFQDAIIEFKFRFEGAAAINAVCDDKAWTGSHAGHICRVTITPKVIRLGDDKEGGMRNDILALRQDAARKAEGDKLMEGRVASFNQTIEPHRWYKMTIEIVGDEMRASLDDRPVGFLKSSGIGHPTKSHFHFTVNGKDAQFDDVRIWAAKGD
jgi:hypothetical protein